MKTDLSWKFEASSFLSGREDWREALRPAPSAFQAESWDRPGVQKLVREAKEAFENKTEVKLPWNLDIHGPWVNFPVEGKIKEVFYQPDVADTGGYRCTKGTANTMVSTAACMAGWLKAASESRWLTMAIEASTSPKGMGSPRTVIDLYKVIDRYTPGAAERRGRSIKDRADEILRPYGLRCSYKGAAVALERGSRAIGKAAILAAAVTLGYDAYQASYRQARSWLASVSRTVSSSQDETDGVRVTLNGPVIEAEFSISRRVRQAGTIRPYFQHVGKTGVRRTPGLLLICAGRSFHASPRWELSLERAIQVAEAAWQQRRETERANRRQQGYDRRLKDVCVLVRLEDSLAAGNCRPGTLEFQRKMGWQGRWYVRPEWLRSTPNHLAWNAASKAEKEVLALMSGQ